MAEIISISNQKGGIGKTTTAVNFAQSLIKSGFRVLLIDTDAQANATDNYNAKINDEITLYDVMKKEYNANEAIQKTEMGDIIPGDHYLYEADQIFVSMGKEYILKESLKPILDAYDYIIIDTPPSLGIMLLNALTASNKIVIPITADRFSIAGLAKLFETLETVKQYSNPALEIAGLLIVKYKEKTNIAKDLIENLPIFAEQYCATIFDTKIRESINISYAQSNKTSVLDFNPNSTVAQDYLSFTNEYLKGVC